MFLYQLYSNIVQMEENGSSLTENNTKKRDQRKNLRGKF